MNKIILVLAALFSSVSASAATPQFAGFECRFEREGNGPWYPAGAMASLYNTDVGFNLLHMQSHWMMGFDKTNYFGGGCSGLQSIGSLQSLVITWVDGSRLDLVDGMGCTFDGEKIKTTTVRKDWNGGEDYFSATHIYTSPEGRQLEFFIAVGMKSPPGIDLQKCQDIFKKEIGGELTYSRGPSPIFIMEGER